MQDCPVTRRGSAHGHEGLNASSVCAGSMRSALHTTFPQAPVGISVRKPCCHHSSGVGRPHSKQHDPSGVSAARQLRGQGARRLFWRRETQRAVHRGTVGHTAQAPPQRAMPLPGLVHLSEYQQHRGLAPWIREAPSHVPVCSSTVWPWLRLGRAGPPRGQRSYRTSTRSLVA